MPEYKNRKKSLGRPKGTTGTHADTDNKARKYAQLAALGVKSKQIRAALGINSSQSLQIIRKHATANGYLQNLQAARDNQVIDIREEIKKVAENCVTYMNISSQIAVTNICKKLQNDGADAEINLAEAKVMREFLDSTEYSGKKAEIPTVTVDVRTESGNAIDSAVNRIDDILSKYLNN